MHRIRGYCGNFDTKGMLHTFKYCKKHYHGDYGDDGHGDDAEDAYRAYRMDGSNDGHIGGGDGDKRTIKKKSRNMPTHKFGKLIESVLTMTAVVVVVVAGMVVAVAR